MRLCPSAAADKPETPVIAAFDFGSHVPGEVPPGLTTLGATLYRPRVLRLLLFLSVLLGGLGLLPGPTSTRVLAQETTADDELPPALRRQLAAEVSEHEIREVDTDPLRILAGAGVGSSLRLVKNDQFQQQRFAPAYLDVYGGIVLPGSGSIRHGFTLGVSVNLSGDGSYSFGIDPFEQWVITPSYLLQVRLGDAAVPDLSIFGRLGVPVALSPETAFGAELGLGAIYNLFAGFGVYVELTGSAWFGGDSRAGNTTVHPVLSGELGVAFDLEVL